MGLLAGLLQDRRLGAGRRGVVAPYRLGGTFRCWRGQWPEVRRALTHGKMFLLLATAAFFIAVNWYVYIVAVQQEQVFQASLGYYINPLVYVLVGVVFLGEQLRRLQGLAVMMATLGASSESISLKSRPWTSGTPSVRK